MRSSRARPSKLPAPGSPYCHTLQGQFGGGGVGGGMEMETDMERERVGAVGQGQLEGIAGGMETHGEREGAVRNGGGGGGGGGEWKQTSREKREGM